jgi:hypothetical protein
MSKKVVYIYFAIVIIIEVVGLFTLPEMIVMQINTEGEANWSINKFLGIGFLFICSFGAGMSALKRNSSDKRSYMILMVMLVLHFIVFFFNS